MTTQTKYCRYSQVQLPCVIREPDGEDCRACLKRMMFNPNICPTCGEDAYEDFKRTGRPHMCMEVPGDAGYPVARFKK